MIRPAESKDTQTIIEIRRQAVLAQPETFWSAAQKLEAANYWDKPEIAADFPNRKILIHTEEGVDAAFIGWKENYLAGLFILPGYQGRRIGAKLLESVEDDVAKSHDNIWLYAHPYAEKFYEKNGYSKLNETSAPFGTEIYKFRKYFR